MRIVYKVLWFRNGVEKNKMFNSTDVVNGDHVFMEVVSLSMTSVTKDEIKFLIKQN